MYKNIVIVVDLSPNYPWHSVLNVALNYVSAFRSQIHLVNIIPENGAGELLPSEWKTDQKAHNDNKLEEIIERYVPSEAKVIKHIGHGIIHHEITNYVNSVGADLVIIPTLRVDGEEEYTLEKSAEKLIKFLPVSTLVVRD